MNKETFYVNSKKEYKFDVYIHDRSDEIALSKDRPFVLVCPGGGYMFTSDREADPIALAYLADGFNVGVLRYSVGEDAAYPNPMVDLSIAIKTVRENAVKWNTNPDKIAICGFSAGGHLVAMQGVHWNDEEIMKASGCMNGENKPNALILGYPVIYFSKNTHSGTRGNLLREFYERYDSAEGEDKIKAKEELDNMVDFASCDKHVGAHTPPTYIFHTRKDNVVPVMHSLKFAEALAENDIDFAMHIFEEGVHGLSTCNHTTDWTEISFVKKAAAEWIPMSCEWLWKHFGK